MTTSFLALGSNLDNPIHQLDCAIQEITQLPRTQVTKQSNYYQNPPMGPQDQPHYVNAVIQITTELTAIQLLQHCLAIETKMGRQRQQHWGARVIDIDIILYGNECIQTDSLTVPHYDLKNRPFVLIPLIAIAPDTTLPSGERVDSFIKKGDAATLTQLGTTITGATT